MLLSLPNNPIHSQPFHINVTGSSYPLVEPPSPPQILPITFTHQSLKSDIYRSILGDSEDDSHVLFRDYNGIYCFLLDFVEEHLEFLFHYSTFTGVYINLLSLLKNFSLCGDQRLSQLLDEFGLQIHSYMRDVRSDVFIKILLVKTKFGRMLMFQYFKRTSDSPLKLSLLQGSFYNELIM